MNNKFINIHEKEIKEYRDEYYKNIILNSEKLTTTHPLITFIIPLLISLLILIVQEFSITGYILGIILLTISNIIIYIFYTSHINKNEYLEAIRRHGYHSIEDYEDKLRKYITGPEGYYNTLLLDLIEKYNLNSSTKRIITTKNEEYYIWNNTKKDKIYLLKTHSVAKPETIILPIANIRYFRVDPITKEVILKTDNDIYRFKEQYVTTFTEMIKEKRLENIKKFEPGIHIDDFEIYMHKVKKSKERNNSLKREKFEQSINYSIYIVIALAIITALGFMISSLVNISNIINCILLIGLNYFVITALNNQTKEVKKTEYEIIQELNNDPDCIEKFQELKYILGIRDTYDRVYTLEGAEYLTWVANGYFHVFLNMIYYNTVFMSIKSSDVKYYKTDYNSCDVKLKDKTLEFRKEADIVFRKILPNKDYNWIKSSQNK